jgi:subtilisin family serine protease
MMRRILALLALGALGLAALVALPSNPRPAGADSRPRIAQELRDRVHLEGRVRVIVKLRLRGGEQVPEGQLGSSAAVAMQRTDIASAQSRVLARLAKRAHRLVHRYRTVPFVAVEVTPDALAELEASAFDVESIVADRLSEPMLSESVPLIGADQAWASGFDGTGTVVVILDTGVDRTHPFLAGRVVDEAC